MNATKIHEAIAEIESEREKLGRAVDVLRSLLPMSDPAAMVGSALDTSRAIFPAEVDKPSYIDDSEAFIRAEGHPLHAKVLAEKISEKRGLTIARSSVESSLIRHIAKAKHPKLSKMGRSTFGLPEWKQQPTLAHIA